MSESALARSEEPKHFAPAEPTQVLAQVPPCRLDDSPVVAGKLLWAGGEKLWIKGGIYGAFRPGGDGAEYPAAETVTRDFAAMRAAGINAVRTYMVPPRWLLDGAQAHGLRVMAGLPWEQHVTFLDEPRRDTTVVIHPLADDRRILPMEKRGELLEAPPEFLLAMSYNPGYQSVLKELKESTRQRFVAIDFRYPGAELERKIIETETGIDAASADQLIKLARMTRNLKGNGLDEGASTRLLVHAAKLIARGIPPRAACHGAIAEMLSDDPEMLRAIDELASSLF